MNSLIKSPPTKPAIPGEIQARWQRIVDLMARVVGSPAGLIMRADLSQIGALRSSSTDGNPYRKGERADLDTGLSCETVMKKRAPLLVSDALKNPSWDHHPDVKLGMTSYLEYPLTWPDGEIFGTICILDEKDNPRATQFRDLISEFQQVIERDLRLMIETHAREGLLADLQQYRNHLKEKATEKTSDLEKSKELIEEALEKASDEIKKLKEQLEAENVYLREEMKLKDLFKDIIGVSNPIKYVMYRIKQVAPSSTTVLLTGETGTGKGLFARVIHEASNRKGKPFVHVNCAGLPPNLIESELFGREKGAFTGSTARQIGRFELANGGTIFLDEIGELPLELQAKLLKVIEDGEFERLGSPHPVKVDVRIIASTNRNLGEAIQNGQFRKDLFYRLNIFPITIPPLRQRREGIPPLVKFFVDKFSRSHGKRFKRIPADTMQVLEDYAWPGNVRELMNVIERAVIVSEGPELKLTDKIEELPMGSVPEKASKGIETKEIKGLVEVEQEHILRILQETGWKIEGHKGAAQLLGMNPSTLRTRMRKLAIQRPRPH